ncbi:MAG TPA: hypothetical protein VFG69_09070 [Nannocystaceae bacterium]|nr:hypothetical protein [Nannocystaceae bacterium]
MRPVEESTPDPGEAAAPPPTRRSERAHAIARGLLWALVVGIGVQLGAGLYEHAAIVSRWATMPGPILVDMLVDSGQVHAARTFWPYVSPIVVALALANATAAWSARGRARGWWFGAALLELLVSAMTYAYFVPELRAFVLDTVPATDVESRALAWASLNGARLVLEAFAWVLALAAFARYGAAPGRPESRVMRAEPPAAATPPKA